ncbi:MAG TPA: serine/threonine-protein kinase [Planctomycetes bacterium]|nr:serine/threonine-protein kinase [Planctomycetota bacterium]
MSPGEQASPSPEERLEEALAEFHERWERDSSLSVEAFLEELPEAPPGLREALETLLDLETDGGLGATLGPRDGERLPPAVGPYLVMGRLGAGGMGTLLMVRGPGEEKGVYAMKLLRKTLSWEPRARERFERECKVLQEISHPGIVRLRGYELDADPPWMVMDLVEGENLQELLRERGPLPPRDAVALLLQVTESVGFLHERGVIHRDLKPANLVLDAKGTPILIDFGLAASGGWSTMTRSGDLLGTPAYMAPELARGERATHLSDIYGLGALLFALLSGRPPHQGEPLSVLERVGRRRPPRLDASLKLPRDLRALVEKAMAFEPEWRFQGAAELGAKLRDFQRGNWISGLHKPLGQRLREEWRFYRPRLFLGAGLLVLALAVPLLSRLVEKARLRDLREALLSGTRAYLAEDWPEAKRMGRQALALDPGDPVARFLAGEETRSPLAQAAARLRAGDSSLALPLAQEAARRNPEAPLPAALLGLAAFRAGKNRLAARELVSARRLLPGTPKLLHFLALTKLRERDPEGAMALLNRALELDPKRPDSLYQRAKLWAGRKDFQKAYADIQSALKLRGKREPSLLNALASFLDGMGRKKEAEAVFREILERFPERPKVLYNLALTLDGLDRIPEAAKVYRMVLDRGPRDPKTLLALAWLYSGSQRETCETCRRQFEEHPKLLDFPAARKLLLEGVAKDGGRNDSILAAAVQIALRIGAEGDLAGLLDSLSRRKKISDRRLGRIVRHKRSLEKHR